MDNDNVTIRKLTERECLRLQGYNDTEIDRLYAAVDENGKRKFSKSAMYKFAGFDYSKDIAEEAYRRRREQEAEE